MTLPATPRRRPSPPTAPITPRRFGSTESTSGSGEEGKIIALPTTASGTALSGSSLVLPYALNDRAVQQAVVLGLEGLGLPDAAANVVVQAQRQGPDLVVRVRYTRLAVRRPSTKLQPVTEHRLESIQVRSRAAISEFFEVVAFDSLVMLHAELRKHNFKWPSGWPVLEYQLKKALERDYLLGRRGGLAEATLPKPIEGLGKA